jgi:hypothetical protein
MKMYGYVCAVLVLGTVATKAGLAAPGQAPKPGGPIAASGKAGRRPVMARAVQVSTEQESGQSTEAEATPRASRRLA